MISMPRTVLFDSEFMKTEFKSILVTLQFIYKSIFNMDWHLICIPMFEISNTIISLTLAFYVNICSKTLIKFSFVTTVFFSTYMKINQFKFYDRSHLLSRPYYLVLMSINVPYKYAEGVNLYIIPES